MKSLTAKHGNEKAENLFREWGKKKSRKGPLNGQWGKSAPEGSGRGISGYYKKYYFRSTYEYYAIKKFERDGIHFEELDRQNVRVKVRVNLPSGRTYRPDFLVGDTIIEVKPKYLLNDEIVLEKKSACKAQYPLYGYKFMTENDLDIDPKEFNRDIEAGLVILDKNKINRYKCKMPEGA